VSLWVLVLLGTPISLCLFKPYRMAIDLGLHLPQHTRAPPPGCSEMQARVVLTRARIWLNCFCTDRSISTQLGKPTITAIRGQDVIPFDLKTWWKCSRWNLELDFHTCMYASVLAVVSGFFFFLWRGCSGIVCYLMY
jgi:hypothetical protein